MRNHLLAVWIAALAAHAAAANEPKTTPAQAQFFETKVRPVLAERCFRCHGSHKQQNGLRLDSRAALLAGGDSGPAVVPGRPKESRLLRAVNHQGPKMPPGEKLKPEQIAALTEWVTMGAPWPEAQALPAATVNIEEARDTHWAFRPVREPRVPAVKNHAWPATDVDRFI